MLHVSFASHFFFSGFHAATVCSWLACGGGAVACMSVNPGGLCIAAVFINAGRGRLRACMPYSLLVVSALFE
jgi:hypothetical protein